MSKENKNLARTFGETKAVELLEERTLRVVATANTLDRDLEVLDTRTARIPVKPSGWKYAADLTVDDEIDLPFLLDHDQWNGIQKQAGSVRKMYINDTGELEAIVKLSTVDNGERVYTLAKEGHLGNSFSIGFSNLHATEDEEGIKNYEVTELSAVFKGSNRNARLVEVKGIKSKPGSSLQDRIKAREQDGNKIIDTHQQRVKGLIADILASDSSWEADEEKWERLQPINEAFYALQEAWYFSATPTEDFEALVAEFAGIAGQVARGENTKSLEMSVELTKSLGKTVEEVEAIVKAAVNQDKNEVEITNEQTETDVSTDEDNPTDTDDKPVEVEAETSNNEVEITQVNEDGTVEAVVDGKEETLKPSDKETAESVAELKPEEVKPTTQEKSDVKADDEEVEAEEPVAGEEITEEEQTEVETQTEVASDEQKEKIEVKETNTDMDNKDIAKSMVAPEQRAEVEVKDTGAKYLKSAEAVKDFAKVLRDTAGLKPEAVKAAWMNHMKEKAVTNPEEILPEAIRSRIVGILENEGPIWSRLNKTGAKAFRVLIDESDPEADTSRAGGHTRGTTKDEEEITLAPRLIRGQLIYKFIRIDRETEFEDDGALIDYVMSELPRRIIAEIERAVVIGDGRASGNKRKIREIVSIREDAVSGDGYADVYTPTAGQTSYQKVVTAESMLEAEGGRILVAKKSFLLDLRLQENGNGGLMFAPGTDLAQTLGYEAIYTPRWMNADTDNDAYVFVPNAYLTVGQNNVEAFSDFALETNQYEYLQEIYVGGALAEQMSAIAIASDGAGS